MPHDTCFFDGQCGMCRRTVKVLHTLDWFHRLDIRDLTLTPESELPVSLETALAGMPMRTRDGRILVGFPAIRRAMAQTIAAPVGWLLYLPIVSWLGDRTYRWVARNRRRACSLPQS